MIRSILKNVSVSSYKTFKERLSDNGVILSERGQTFSYAFLDANNKQRRARETRLGSDFGRETILHIGDINLGVHSTRTLIILKMIMVMTCLFRLN